METVYLLHFSQPISTKHTTQHYLGYSTIFEHRMRLHLSGKGAKLCKIAKKLGVSWTVVRTWTVPDGYGRQIELKLKQMHGNRLCPHCNPKAYRRARLEKEFEDWKSRSLI